MKAVSKWFCIKYRFSIRSCRLQDRISSKGPNQTLVRHRQTSGQTLFFFFSFFPPFFFARGTSKRIYTKNFFIDFSDSSQSMMVYSSFMYSTNEKGVCNKNLKFSLVFHFCFEKSLKNIVVNTKKQFVQDFQVLKCNQCVIFCITKI